MADRDEIIDQFLGDAATPIEWASEEEKRLHFWFDDLHCPQPISPMWFDVGGWWLTCGYMYRRFGAPFGKDWVAKVVNGYVMTAVQPRDAREARELTPYYEMVMPVYAARFLEWWQRRYLPEIRTNFGYLDSFPLDDSSLPELMVLLEDALDIQERHFRLHWILNLAQFQSALTLERILEGLIGKAAGDLCGRILISDDDRNWDSVRELWRLKEKIRPSGVLMAAFTNPDWISIMAALRQSAEGKALFAEIEAYRAEYGNKSMFTHEYLSATWRECPAPIYEALRSYLASDYDYEEDIRRLRAKRAAAIAEMWSLVPAETSAATREELRQALECALKMAPLTPDHHFYLDQGTYARVRLVFMAIGRALVARGILIVADEVFFLRYHELRVISADHQAFDARASVAARREEHARAARKRPPYWVGTITQWSMYSEPYKANWGWPAIYQRSIDAHAHQTGVIRGLGASSGVVEGIARLVDTPEQFDQVRPGEILVCRTTNPGWVVVFTKIAGLITDAGGALSHPAVVSREFGIPAVVGATGATRRIRTGQRVRIDGGKGLIEVLAVPHEVPPV